MLYTGIDLVSINRFSRFNTYQPQKLQRMFSKSETEYCLSSTIKYSERFAARFAAKEALFKALTHYDPNHQIPFLTFLTACEVQKTSRGICTLSIQWHKFSSFSQKTMKNITTSLSLTHEAEYAIALVLLTSKE